MSLIFLELVMGKIDSLVGKRLNYDQNIFPFDKLFLDIVNKYFKQNGIGTISALKDIHTVVDQSTLDPVYGALYDFMSTEKFLTLYRNYIKSIIAPQFGEQFFYQKKPGIRIHLPQTKTVQYHTDEWYGHGENVINFWTPLTYSYGSNSLYVASLEESTTLIDRLEKSRAPMSEINLQLAKISKPLDINLGETFCFCARVAHGTERNETADTRVSLDYRVLLSGEDPGSKSITDYYEDSINYGAIPVKAKTKTAIKATSYIFPKYGFTKFISQHEQRLLNQDYAVKNQITILAEETEIKTMPHHPMLLSLAEGQGTHKINSVLLYSVMCLPETSEDRNLVYNSAKRNGTSLFFANEGLVFPECSEQEIENKRVEFSRT
jgi:sporadic carbohydrate cluster 2OG-Fe(II) oxygenase/sporadic carbohydrate cluster protein (TIGR04323 family)